MDDGVITVVVGSEPTVMDDGVKTVVEDSVSVTMSPDTSRRTIVSRNALVDVTDDGVTTVSVGSEPTVMLCSRNASVVVMDDGVNTVVVGSEPTIMEELEDVVWNPVTFTSVQRAAKALEIIDTYISQHCC